MCSPNCCTGESEWCPVLNKCVIDECCPVGESKCVDGDDTCYPDDGQVCCEKGEEKKWCIDKCVSTDKECCEYKGLCSPDNGEHCCACGNDHFYTGIYGESNEF